MKTILKITVIAISLVFMLMADISVLQVQLVPDADAIFGVRRRAFRRGVMWGAAASATASAAHYQAAAGTQQQSATAQQQSATAQQQSATAQQQSATAQQQSAMAAQHQTAAAPPAPSGGGALPLGTVVSSLPPGCVSTPYKDVEYYRCGDNYYRAVFQGNSLVYVTSKP